jgi:hypothetical protein
MFQLFIFAVSFSAVYIAILFRDKKAIIINLIGFLLISYSLFKYITRFYS